MSMFFMKVASRGVEVQKIAVNIEENGFLIIMLSMAMNILGKPLKVCSLQPLTGYLRDGKCCCISNDPGNHIVCAVMTDAFLAFSLRQGNDLVTPRPEYEFPGLKDGDNWCLCLDRWLEAYEAGVAPDIVSEATHVAVTEHLDLAVLKAYGC